MVALEKVQITLCKLGGPEVSAAGITQGALGGTSEVVGSALGVNLGAGGPLVKASCRELQGGPLGSLCWLVNSLNKDG